MTSPEAGFDKTTVAFLILGLLILVWLRSVLRSRKNPLVLLLGSSGAGKTTLFYQLQGGSSYEGTVPSIEQNVDTLLLQRKDGKSVKIDVVDIPGHPKVRGEAQRYYSRANRIVFMVDAVDFMVQKSGVSEHLYEVISHPIIQKRRLPILMVCNKSDQGAKAHTVEFIKKRLEKEIEAVRATRATLGEGAKQEASIAKPGEIFTFAGLKAVPVTVCSAAALLGQIAEVKSFLL